MTWTKELDEAAVLATKTGYWHVVLFYLLCGLAAIPTSFLVFSQVFTNATPEHWCAPPPELDHLGLPDQLLRSLTVPGEQGTYESCTAYDIDRKELREALRDFIVERIKLQLYQHEVRKLYKNVLRLHRATFSKIRVCSLFYVDAALQLSLMSLLTNYIVVLLQFSIL
ncbi:uncharacterized protein LOC111351050 [Spodoptera litura]|uniref:Uncharacterized protein LOC111351050 n=1 Tax=Spodoptera litura TaxID=69820 RepID=A0A9J7DXS5_SPOLT|nr:uncharacterized protein LOC111351050 [Spodoptera litura]